MDNTIIVRTIIGGVLQTNCYILGDPQSGDAVVIDPGAEGEKIKTAVKKENLKINAVLLTHGHFDHIGALSAFSSLPVFMHKNDEMMVRNDKECLSFAGADKKNVMLCLQFLADSDLISVGELKLKAIHTPGHTPGGMCFLVRDILFSGDTLFNCGVGRTDLPGGSLAQLMGSIRDKLMCLPDDTVVFPGHGQPTTIGEEKEGTAFV
ncbi:MAG: MBL fold metallo-hydrolase [Candidatus Omnitrophica bacterium]|nr:MBL fold metallo-hydrolase [Candidatus Omnitrophota bacterium]MBU4478161.1 MBL fold metallo-hydrolase [Candidatus Omnitrophota bacterium]MCG2703082.1 MBL fold metallo-hydrolase [Candidatus Omnitrophota bacterium]